jgi:hypothetical protein
MCISDELPEYLVEALLEALRRDLRREESLTACGQASSAEVCRHGLNAHFNRQILQILRPKTIRPASSEQARALGRLDITVLPGDEKLAA